MDDRRRLSPGLAALVAPLTLALGCGIAAAAAVACSAPDPGEITFAERRGGTDPVGPGPGATDAGGGGGDAGGAVDAGPSDPIFGTAPFAYVNPGIVANQQGGMNHNGTVEGKNCIDTGCHATGQPGPNWLIGGTVYNAATGGQPVAQAEIRVVDPANNEVAKAYTDPNGNFWLMKVAGDIPANSKVGVRTATKVMRMATTVGGPTGGACNNTNGCHGPAMRVYVN